MKIPVNEIKINEGRRKTDQSQVHQLIKSIGEVGLINPITVDPNHTLIAGLHRLTAAKALGWTEIECTVSNLEGIEAKLAEIDENIIRTNLTVQEQGELLKRRKMLYETLHPETKAGVSQANGMNKALGNNVSCNAQSTCKSFIQDTAEKLHMHPSTISRHLRIASTLTPKTADILSGMKKYPKQSELLKLCGLPPLEQEKVAELLAAGAIRSVAEYLNLRACENASTDTEEFEDDVSDKASIKEQNDLTDNQKSAVMLLSYITDYVSEQSRDLRAHETAFLSLPADYLAQVSEMLDELKETYDYLHDIVVQAQADHYGEGGTNVEKNDS